MTVALSFFHPPALSTGPALVANQRGGGRRAAERDGEPVSREAISAWITRHADDLDRATNGWPQAQRNLFAGLVAVAALDPVHSATAKSLKDALFRAVEAVRKPCPVGPDLGAQERTLREALSRASGRAQDFLRHIGASTPFRS